MEPFRRLPARGSVYDHNCPARTVLNHVTGRWGSLTLGLLLRGPRRFAQIRDALSGISEKVLAETLRNLERDGLVARRVLDGVPPGVEYSLTAFGADCAQRVDALIDWIEERTGLFVAAQAAWQARSREIR